MQHTYAASLVKYAAPPVAPRINPKPTSHDVARVAGVSQPTVSRALRDDTQVSPETRQRVRAAAEQLGYVPSRRGRSLATQSTDHIALVVGALDNPFYTDAVNHLHTRLSAIGHRVVVVTDEPYAPPSPDALTDGSIDGVILTTATLDATLPGALAARGVPVVLFNRATDEGIDACVSENERGAALAAGEIARLGHRRVGAIFGPEDTSTGRDRERGFRAALESARLTLPDSRVRRGSFTFHTGEQALPELLDQRHPPTAVFCANDVIAIGALNAAHRLGLSVPGDVTIIGFDDIPMAAWALFSLTTVRQDLARMADTAVRMLADRIAQPDRPAQRVTVPTTLVHRRTHAARSDEPRAHRQASNPDR
jgi:LacI family transcriptional regulator